MHAQLLQHDGQLAASLRNGPVACLHWSYFRNRYDGVPKLQEMKAPVVRLSVCLPLNTCHHFKSKFDLHMLVLFISARHQFLKISFIITAR